jgi:hypothetical protein
MVGSLSCDDERKQRRLWQLLIELDVDTLKSLQLFSMELGECQA